MTQGSTNLLFFALSPDPASLGKSDSIEMWDMVANRLEPLPCNAECGVQTPHETVAVLRLSESFAHSCSRHR